MSEPDADMRRTILDRAASLFVERGYDGISMREVADACGLSKAGIYYHYRDKEDLFLAVLDAHLDELAGLVAAAQAQPGGVRRQAEYFAREVFAALPAGRRALIRLAGQEMKKLSPDRREAFAGRYHARFSGALANMLAGGIARGEMRSMDAETAAWAFMGLLYPFLNADPPPGTPDLLVAIFFDGVGR